MPSSSEEVSKACNLCSMNTEVTWRTCFKRQKASFQNSGYQSNHCIWFILRWAGIILVCYSCWHLKVNFMSLPLRRFAHDRKLPSPTHQLGDRAVMEEDGLDWLCVLLATVAVTVSMERLQVPCVSHPEWCHSTCTFPKNLLFNAKDFWLWILSGNWADQVQLQS